MLLVCGVITCSYCLGKGVLRCFSCAVLLYTLIDWRRVSCNVFGVGGDSVFSLIRGGCFLVCLVSSVIAYAYGLEEGVFQCYCCGGY